MRERAIHFVTCAPGIEPMLHEELRALKLSKLERQIGGAKFEGDMRDAWRVNLWSRTAVRVLRRLTRFPAQDREALYAGVRELPWERYLRPSGSLFVNAKATRSRLDHTQFVEQVVKDAIVDRFRDQTGERPSVNKEDPDLRLHAHLVADRATLSLDTSGQALHRRGWRQHQGRAPLAENTAAALVLSSGWDARAPLLDPFCGTGTILIEAAWIAAGLAPGLMRSFGFERWPGHDERGYAAERERARASAKPLGKPTLLGWDLDAERVAEARENAASAGLAERITFEVGDALELAPRAGWNAWIVTNLPYGVRVGSEDELFDLYRGFGHVLRERCQGYRATLLSGNPRLRKKLGLSRAGRHAIVNGGLDCEIVQVDAL